MSLTLRQTIELISYRRNGVLAAALGGALIRVANTAMYQYLADETHTGQFGAILQAATTAAFAYLGIDGDFSNALVGFGQTPLYDYQAQDATGFFGNIVVLADTPLKNYQAQDGSPLLGTLVVVSTTGEYVYAAQDGTGVIGGLTGVGDTSTYVYVGQDGVPVLGTLTSLADTPAYVYAAQDAVASLGAISGTADTPDYTYAAQDATFANILIETGDTPSYTHEAQDATATLGAITGTGDTPSYAYAAQDATGDTGGTDPWADWSHYFEINSDNTQIASTQTDIIAWFDLRNAPASFWTNLGQTDGDDIRVANSDGSTEYPTYVMFIDTTAETGLVAAKVSSLSGSVDTTYRMYIGNSTYTPPAVTAALGRNAVFDWQWDHVHGMFEKATAETDLTGNGHNGTISASLTDETTNTYFGKGIGNLTPTNNLELTIPNDATIHDGVVDLTVLWAQHKIGTADVNEDPWGFSAGDRCRLQIGRYRDRWATSQKTTSGADGDHDDVNAALAMVKNGTNDENWFIVDGVKGTVGTGATDDGPTGLDFQIMRSDTSRPFRGTMSLMMYKAAIISDDTITTTHNMWADSSFWDWGTIVAN